MNEVQTIPWRIVLNSNKNWTYCIKNNAFGIKGLHKKNTNTSLGSWKDDCFLFVSDKILKSFFIICFFFLDLSHLFSLFTTNLFSKLSILIILFRKLFKEKIHIFWYCIYVVSVKVVCDIEWEKCHYKYHESKKWQSVVLIVKNANNQKI